MWDALWIDAHLATMAGPGPYGAIRDGAIGLKAGRIAWVGRRAELPGTPVALARRVHSAEGGWITPGLIDCHTHLVFAGTRAGEFEMRLQGRSYEEIARAEGGILSTVRATRGATVDELVEASAPRLQALMRGGATTVEIKSGYGLDLAGEEKQLIAAAALGQRHKVRIAATYLALHALPPEFAQDRAAYVAQVCDTAIPAIARAGLAEAVDAFCERIAFTPAETDQVFAAARAHGLRVKLHAEQLSDMGGAALAARHGALSADHLEHASEAGIAAMAAAGTVAVLLPGAFYALRETRMPPVPKLRAADLRMAVATDCNPGTSPLASPLLAMNMACTLFRLTPEEALAGMTVHAAAALGKQDEIGALTPGKAGDLAVWRIAEPAELAYWLGADLLQARVFAGEVT